MAIVITGKNLTIEVVYKVAYDEEKVELTDEPDCGLDLGVDEPGNVDIGEPHHEVEDHDEQHGPGELPDMDPHVPCGQIGGVTFQ